METGYVGSLTAEQEEGLLVLKRLITESDLASEYLADDDTFLLKFLRATMPKRTGKFKPHDAFSRIRATLEWRREMGLNKPFETIPRPSKMDEYEQIRPTYRWSDERVGSMVMIERFGLMGTYLEKQQLSETEWIQCLAYQSEHARHTMHTGFAQEPRGMYAIVDTAGIGLAFAKRISQVKLMSSVAAQHFPETLHRVYVVNAPWIAEKMFNLCKTFMDPVTASKVVLSSSVPTQLFQEQFDLSKLPHEYGGDAQVSVPVPRDAQRKKTTDQK